jgi:hypothetical protein
MNTLHRLPGVIAFWITSTSLALADVAPPEPGIGGDLPAGNGAMVPVMGGLVAIGMGVVVFMWMKNSKKAQS